MMYFICKEIIKTKFVFNLPSLFLWGYFTDAFWENCFDQTIGYSSDIWVKKKRVKILKILRINNINNIAFTKCDENEKSGQYCAKDFRQWILKKINKYTVCS